MKPVAELRDGDRVIGGLFLVASVSKGVTNAGRTYINVTLQDYSGSIEAKKWEVYEGDFETFVAGNVVSVDGEVNLFKNVLQFKILAGGAVPMEGLDLTRFVQNAPVPKKELEAKLKGYLDSIENEDVKRILDKMVGDYYSKYVDYPAASRNHHNYASGLMYHSLSMADLAEQVAKLYPSLNRDLLIAGCLLHDIGKIYELSGPIATEYTTEGKLLGHISIGAAEIRMAAKELGIDGDVPLLLEHMILAHHGRPEYGSAVTAETREALALSIIDDFDAKMVILDKAMAGIKKGEWTPRVMTMDGKNFYVHSLSKEE